MDILDYLLARLGPLPLLLLGLLLAAALSAALALGRSARVGPQPAGAPAPAGLGRSPAALPAQRRPAEQQHRS